MFTEVKTTFFIRYIRAVEYIAAGRFLSDFVRALTGNGCLSFNKGALVRLKYKTTAIFSKRGLLSVIKDCAVDPNDTP